MGNVVRTFLLQDWTTLRSSLAQPFVQDPDSWLDLDGFSDVVCWIDIAEVTPPGGTTRNYLQLQIQTAPSCDDAYFVPVAAPLSVGVQAPFTMPASVPVVVRSATSTVTNNLMRYLRWSITPFGSGSWDIAFRIHAVAARSTTFVPPLLPGCVIWYRADLGVTVAAGTSNVTGWNDQSGTNDANKNLATGVSPSLVAADASYMNQPTIAFNAGIGTYLVSGIWTNLLSQPATWIVVGHTSAAGSNEVAFESNSAGSIGHNVSRTAGNDVQIKAPNAVTTASMPQWTNPSVLLGEFNGAASNVYFNNFTTAVATGPSGGNSTNSLTVGSSDHAIAIGNFWGGTLAEIIGYTGLLTATSKAQLRNYLRGRYGLAIG